MDTQARPAIAFIDLQAQRRAIGEPIERRIRDVLEHGGFIMGPEVGELEAGLAGFSSVRHAIGCSNGTDALSLVLRALGVGAGDAVICPSFTFAATAEVVALVGATPVFADVDDVTYNLDPESLRAAIATARAEGLRPAGVIPVDLFGLPADYDVLGDIAAGEGMWVMSDTAQGYGSTYKGRPAGSLGLAAGTSFFPAKPLGCYGDGGAVFTDDDALADVIRSLLVHGKGEEKYDNVRIGVNARLDTIQAAILLEKLAVFPAELEARDRVARRYSEALSDIAVTPSVPDDRTCAWAQYTIRMRDAERGGTMAALKAAGVPTAVYYPKPLHQQTAYRDFPTAGGGALDVCERLSAEVFSLPMHPYLNDEAQNYIIDQVRRAAR